MTNMGRLGSGHVYGIPYGGGDGGSPPRCCRCPDDVTLPHRKVYLVQRRETLPLTVIYW